MTILWELWLIVALPFLLDWNQGSSGDSQGVRGWISSLIYRSVSLMFKERCKQSKWEGNYTEYKEKWKWVKHDGWIKISKYCTLKVTVSPKIVVKILHLSNIMPLSSSSFFKSTLHWLSIKIIIIKWSKNPLSFSLDKHKKVRQQIDIHSVWTIS